VSERTPSDVVLRETTDADIPILYEFQLDPEATRIAAFPAREWEAFRAHQERIRADETLIARTIVAGGQVAGSIGSYPQDGKRLVGYWIGRDYWGKGIATRALAALLDLDQTRPIYAFVAKHNTGSQRVLEKCGFSVISEEHWFDDKLGAEIEEYLMELPG
jgi:RimJ/RimL family protein N-acetyltransferase